MTIVTVELDDRHSKVLQALCEKRGLSKVGLLRQALRLYQLIDDRLERGYELALRDRSTGEFHAVLVPELGGKVER